MTAPRARPEPDGDLYDFAEDVPSRQRVVVPQQLRTVAAKVPTTPAKAGEGAVAPAAPNPIEYQQPATRSATGLDRLFPDRIKDLWMPVALIGGGSLIEIVHVVFFQRMALAPALRSIGYELVITTAILSVAALIAAKARQINFGPPIVAIFKLCAVVIGSTGVTLLLAPLFGLVFGWMPYIGGLPAMAIPLLAFFTLLGTLFDLDQSDTWYCVCVMFIVYVAVYLVQIKFW